MTVQPTAETLRAYLAPFGIMYEDDGAGGRVRVREQRLVRVTEAYVSTPTIPPPGEAVLDVYGAQDAYLRQAPPRADLACECSDAACRARLHPRITAAAYERPDREEFEQKPHFRWNPHDPHAADCRWVLAEVAAREAQAAVMTGADVEQLREERAPRRPQTRRRSDHVDVFVVRNPGDVAVGEDSRDLSFLEGLGLDPAAPRASARRLGAAYAGAAVGAHDVRSTYLREVISSYNKLKREGRETTETLRIERVERTYYEWFRVVSLYHANVQDPKRVWSGGVRAIEDLGDWWALRFFDETRLGGFAEPANLVLNKHDVGAHPRGAYLAETVRLMLEREVGYLKAWFYGVVAVDAARQPGRRLVADFGGNLELVHLAVPEPNP